MKSKWIAQILKLTIVGLLFWWMISSGKLSMSQMAIIFQRPEAIVASIAVWILGPVILGTLRWWCLMRGLGLSCDFGRALKLQLVGFFFNTAMPGAVGGDIVKAIYIVKDQQDGAGKTPAMLTVLLDRIVGLIGLFIMGAVTAVLSYHQLAENPVTAQLLKGLVLVVCLSVLFLAIVFVPYKEGKDPVLRLLSLKLPMLSTVKGIYTALRNYREKPGTIFITILLSVLIQVMFLWFMGFMGKVLYGSENFDTALLAPIFPFGILVTAIPLAPGGLGVGHAAFDKLFSMVGLPGGANVFNVYALSQLLLNLIGVIPYFLLRAKLPEISDDKVRVT